MRGAWLVLVAGCRFEPGAFRPDAVSDAAPDYCDGTLACYRFDDDALDSSGNGLNAVTSNIAFGSGMLGSALVMIDGTSAADVPDSAVIDVTSALTIEGWIKPTALPGAGERMGMLDCQGQFGLFLLEGGNMRCTMSAAALQTSATIVVGEWNHVACTFDGTTTRLYVRGALVGEGTGTTALSTAGTSGFSIAADNPPGSGDQLAGMIDELRLLPIALVQAEICVDANASCP
jgi:hypothetical protein